VISVALFAKAPVAGQVKTRLTPPLTREEAAVVARACLEATIASVANDPALPVTLFLEGALDESLERLVRSRSIDVRPQGAGGLGERLRAAFEVLFAAGASGAIAIGSDSPSLPAGRLREAAAALLDHDAVLGPAEDGGYYLLGLARPEWRLLEGIPWSTGAVSRVTLERAAAIGASVRVLEPWYDVDDIETLGRALADAPRGGAFRGALGEIESKLQSARK